LKKRGDLEEIVLFFERSVLLVCEVQSHMGAKKYHLKMMRIKTKKIWFF